MKHIYFSELLNKNYTSEEECVIAEEQYKKEQIEKKKKLEEEQLKKEQKNVEKEKAINKIKETEKNLQQTLNRYAEAKEEVKKIKAECMKRTTDILTKSRADIKQAELERYTAIGDFNKKFGAYITVANNSEVPSKEAFSIFEDNLSELISRIFEV